ncbi:EAL domain-containing protein [Pseudoalteromonas sp. Of7M-16]|uniref:putative bifunctional diguanylate cyclase/phosphodiesterase n=1 Tax=Pseudoalteromonas sp. Of7M-16 TaxID=2917756 RepID=UPI001EF54E2F|nr:EAL domain-containing protein [Pseudoalteromonas sp. Of7M-16]MCG7549594.1 EAL domain-containing protein [Pseudoalteromonas sp. Of7M-16]
MNRLTQKLLLSFFFLLVGLSFGIQISQFVENWLFTEAGHYGNESLIELFNYFSLAITGFVMAVVLGAGVIYLARKKQQEIGFGEHGELYYEVFRESLNAQFLVCENGTLYAVSQGFCGQLEVQEEDLTAVGLKGLIDERSFERFMLWQSEGEDFELLSFKLSNFEGKQKELVVSLNHTHLAGVYLGQLVDVDKQSELQKQHELLAITLSSVGDGVICTDINNRITFMNPVAEAVLALLTDEVKGQDFEEVVPLYQEDSKEPIDDPMRQSMTELQTVCLNELICFRNHLGLDFAIEVCCSPIFLRGDKIAGAVLVFQDVTESRLLRKKMNHLAHHDALTGLPNRLLLQDRLVQSCKRAKRHKHQFALIFLDLNKFKAINDSLGHDNGDELLKQVAKRLTASIRACDTVSRIGGDEFVLLIDSMEDRRHVRLVVDKVFQASGGHYELRATQVNVSFSAGVALYPDDGENADSLMKSADTAMYRAKKVGHSNYQFYCPELDKEAELYLEKETAMIKALHQKAFLAHFQPILNAQTLVIEKLEVLARWQCGDELIVAEQFVDVAESAGINGHLSMYVFELAIPQFVIWLERYPDLQLCLNLSIKHLLNGMFSEQLMALLDKHQLKPQQFELEIAEQPLLERADELKATLDSLRQQGFHLAIDDFGVGHTNPSLLRELHFDSIKIDPSFINEIGGAEHQDDLAMVMINIAKSLGVNCIAEGVECEMQAKALAANGCDQLQGHFFSKPVPSSEVNLLLEKSFKQSREP